MDWIPPPVEWKHETSCSKELIALPHEWRWSGGVKVSCILRHRGVQLILAYSWAKPAILLAGKGRGAMFLFLLFLYFIPVPISYLSLFHLLYYLCLFSPFLCFLLFLHFHFLLLPCPSFLSLFFISSAISSSLSLSFISSTTSSLFSLSLGDDTKWLTRVDMSLNPNTINRSPFLWETTQNDPQGLTCH